jgi:hypothetical protein
MAGEPPTEPQPGDLVERVSALEQAVAGLAECVVTRRLAVVDNAGTERIVATVVRTAGELRVQIAGAPAEVVLYADQSDLPGASPAVGLQLRAGGDAVAELDASAGADGRWRATLVRSVPSRLSGTAPLHRRPATAGPPSPSVPGPSGSPA